MPSNSPVIKAGLSITNSNWLPNKRELVAISFLNKIKSITSDKTRLIIIKYETGFVSLFIVLLKLNKSKAIKKEAIIGSAGISQVRFNNIAIKQA